MIDHSRSGENAAGAWRWKAGSGHRRTPTTPAPIRETDQELDPHTRPPAAHELAGEALYMADETPGLDELHQQPGHPTYRPKGAR